MDEIQQALQQRYSHVHPLIFLRSLEKARSNGELFDILEGIPTQYPLIWCDEERCWKAVDNLLQTNLIKNNHKIAGD